MSVDVCRIGSREFGGVTEKSDWDYILSEDTYKSIVKYLDNNIQYNIYGENEDNIMHNLLSIKFKDSDNNIINLIVYKDIDIPKIIDVHDIIGNVCKSKAGINIDKCKIYRVNIFETIISNIFDDIKYCHCDYKKYDNYDINLDLDEDEISF